MNKFTHLLGFVQCLFDEEKEAKRATGIIQGIIQGHSPRLSDISREMRGNEAANYKKIQRFLQATNP
ncbi:MAG: transposase, partial [Ignavibacteria bacterium]